MAWKETDAMKERVKFLLAWEREWERNEGRVNMTALCEAFGVSRPTGYEWVRRFQEGGHRVEAAKERSRRPHTSPTAVGRELEELVVAARKKFPRWGPRKLRDVLQGKHPKLRSLRRARSARS